MAKPLTPPEIWIGIARAMSNASGCRVVLQNEIVEADKDDPNTSWTVGHREVAAADPNLFVKPA